MRDRQPIVPTRALARPRWLGALLLLVLNDHVFKGAGLLPGWLTGKASDVAGLLVAPTLLVALLGLHTRTAVAWAHVLTGAVFAAIQVWEPAARGIEGLTALGPFPWRVTMDPLDLLALPLILVSWRVLVPAMERPVVLRPLARTALLGASALACVATSDVDPPPATQPRVTPPPVYAKYATELVIGNDTKTAQVVRIRPIRSSVTLNCDALAADPTGILSRGLFGPARVWLVEPDRTVPVRDTTSGSAQAPPCSAYLVDATQMPMRLIFYTRALTTMAISSYLPDAAPSRTLRLGQPATLTAVFPAPPVADPQPDATCGDPGAAGEVDWSTPVPAGQWTISALTEAPDGCGALDLANEQAVTTRWYLCTPELSLPLAVGDRVVIQTAAIGQSGTVDGVTLETERAVVRVGRGASLVRFSDDPVSVLSTTGECPPYRDDCGSLLVPVDLVLSGGGFASQRLSPGTAVSLPAGGRLHVIRAQGSPALDSACTAADAGAITIESAFVWEEVTP